MCPCRYWGFATCCPREAVWRRAGSRRAERYFQLLYILRRFSGKSFPTCWFLFWVFYLEEITFFSCVLFSTSSTPPASSSPLSLIGLIKLNSFPPTHWTNGAVCVLMLEIHVRLCVLCWSYKRNPLAYLIWKRGHVGGEIYFVLHRKYLEQTAFSSYFSTFSISTSFFSSPFVK